MAHLEGLEQELRLIGSRLQIEAVHLLTDFFYLKNVDKFNYLGNPYSIERKEVDIVLEGYNRQTYAFPRGITSFDI